MASVSICVDCFVVITKGFHKAYHGRSCEPSYSHPLTRLLFSYVACHCLLTVRVPSSHKHVQCAYTLLACEADAGHLIGVHLQLHAGNVSRHHRFPHIPCHVPPSLSPSPPSQMAYGHPLAAPPPVSSPHPPTPPPSPLQCVFGVVCVT